MRSPSGDIAGWLDIAAGCGRNTRRQGGELFEFREELPMTEWLGGEIRVERDEEGILRALWNGKVINKH